MSSVPSLFRVLLEVGDLEAATRIYQQLLAAEGTRHRGARHYFDCDGVTIALLDVSQGGRPPAAGATLSFDVDDLAAVHRRAEPLGVLATYDVHGEPAGAIALRPWGERSFYVVDPWGNDLCFCQRGTRFT